MTTKGLYFDGTKKQYAHFNGQDMGLPVGGTDRTLEFWMRAPVGSGDTGIVTPQPVIEIREPLDNKGDSASVFAVFLTTQAGVTYIYTGNQGSGSFEDADPFQMRAMEEEIQASIVHKQRCAKKRELFGQNAVSRWRSVLFQRSI